MNALHQLSTITLHRFKKKSVLSCLASAIFKKRFDFSSGLLKLRPRVHIVQCMLTSRWTVTRNNIALSCLQRDAQFLLLCKQLCQIILQRKIGKGQEVRDQGQSRVEVKLKHTWALSRILWRLISCTCSSFVLFIPTFSTAKISPKCI